MLLISDFDVPTLFVLTDNFSFQPSQVTGCTYKSPPPLDIPVESGQIVRFAPLSMVDTW